VLGHWYLVIPSMEIRHLQRIVGFHIATLIGRVAIVGIVLALAVGVPLATGQSLRRYVTSVDGIFFWQRVLFGLAVPAVLSYLTWETAKIRSTQSATGILYVDFFTVVVGEVLAAYVLLSTGLAV
jgi:protein NrfD